MKHFGYKGTGPIGCNNNGVIDPVKATTRSNSDTTGLGFKKVPFHLGSNKFIPILESSSENESQSESGTREEESDDEDSYPHPIPYDLAKFFAEPNDFVPRVSTMDDTSDSSEDNTEQLKYHSKKGESSQSCHIEYLCKNPELKESMSLSLLGSSILFHHVVPILMNMNLTIFQKQLLIKTLTKCMSMKIKSK